MAPSNVRASTSESSSGASSWPKSEVSPRASSGFTVRRPVGEVDDTGAERLGVHKLQLLPITSLLEEAPPAAHDNRMDHDGARRGGSFAAATGRGCRCQRSRCPCPAA